MPARTPALALAPAPAPLPSSPDVQLALPMTDAIDLVLELKLQRKFDDYKSKNKGLRSIRNMALELIDKATSVEHALRNAILEKELAMFVTTAGASAFAFAFENKNALSNENFEIEVARIRSECLGLKDMQAAVDESRRRERNSKIATRSTMCIRVSLCLFILRNFDVSESLREEVQSVEFAERRHKSEYANFKAKARDVADAYEGDASTLDEYKSNALSRFADKNSVLAHLEEIKELNSSLAVASLATLAAAKVFENAEAAYTINNQLAVSFNRAIECRHTGAKRRKVFA